MALVFCFEKCSDASCPFSIQLGMVRSRYALYRSIVFHHLYHTLWFLTSFLSQSSFMPNFVYLPAVLTTIIRYLPEMRSYDQSGIRTSSTYIPLHVPSLTVIAHSPGGLLWPYPSSSYMMVRSMPWIFPPPLPGKVPVSLCRTRVNGAYAEPFITQK